MNQPEQYLRAFLDSKISIGKGIRSRASTSQKALRDFLVGEYDRDKSFPRILQQNDSEFIGGSFARHTKIWPLDDIDIYFPIDGRSLAYYERGVATNAIVVTDGTISANPVLGPRWMTGQYVSSDKLAAGFRAVLKRKYPNTVIQPPDQSISIQTTIGASGESDGINFDAVPCFTLKPPNLSYVVYLIPSGRDGWVWTNPRIDEALCSNLQTWHHDLYRPAVRIVKYWEAVRFGGRLGSYYTELACSKHFLSLMNSTGHRHIYLTHAVADAFAAVARTAFGGNQQSFVANAPPVSPKQPLAVAALNVISGIASKAQIAVQCEASNLGVRAENSWREILES